MLAIIQFTSNYVMHVNLQYMCMHDGLCKLENEYSRQNKTVYFAMNMQVEMLCNLNVM